MSARLYTKSQAARILNLSIRQLTYWSLIGAVRPHIVTRGSKSFQRFTEKDLRLLGSLKVLTDEGIPVGRAIRRLRTNRPAGLLPVAQFHQRLLEEENRSIRFNITMTCLIIRSHSRSDSNLVASALSEMKRSYDLLTSPAPGRYLWVTFQSGPEQAAGIMERVRKHFADQEIMTGISTAVPQQPGDRLKLIDQSAWALEAVFHKNHKNGESV